MFAYCSREVLKESGMISPVVRINRMTFTREAGDGYPQHSDILAIPLAGVVPEPKGRTYP
jgi:hypothetical protein